MKSLIIELAILKLEAPYIFLEYINEEARADWKEEEPRRHGFLTVWMFLDKSTTGEYS